MTKLAIRDPKTPIAKGIAVGTNSPPMPAMGAVRNPPRAPIQRSGIARPSPRRAVMMPATPAPIAPIVAPIGQLLKSPMRALMLAAIRLVIPAPMSPPARAAIPSLRRAIPAPTAWPTMLPSMK